MAKGQEATRNPGVLCAVGLAAAWWAAWVVLMGCQFRSDHCPIGVPLITWSMIALGVLSILLSIVLIFKMDAFEKK